MLQVSVLYKDNTKYRCTFTDGERSVEGYIGGKVPRHEL